MNKRWAAFIGAGLVIVVTFAVFVWPTLWVYTSLKTVEKGRDREGTVIEYRYRTNRFTGQKQVYYNEEKGWVDFPE